MITEGDPPCGPFKGFTPAGFTTGWYCFNCSEWVDEGEVLVADGNSSIGHLHTRKGCTSGRVRVELRRLTR